MSVMTLLIKILKNVSIVSDLTWNRIPMNIRSGGTDSICRFPNPDEFISERCLKKSCDIELTRLDRINEAEGTAIVKAKIQTIITIAIGFRRP